jgi:hypothetical protein
LDEIVCFSQSFTWVMDDMILEVNILLLLLLEQPTLTNTVAH